VALSASLVAIACGGDDSPPGEGDLVAIDAVHESRRDPGHLVLDLPLCNSRPPTIDVEETDVQVRLTVTALGHYEGDCRRNGTVELDDPLNGRQVIDGSTGDEVPVRA
jgi:hypothetical protein